jgi:hypothetical protein
MGQSVTTSLAASATRHSHCRNNCSLNQNALFALKNVTRDFDIAYLQRTIWRTAYNSWQGPSRIRAFLGDCRAFLGRESFSPCFASH